MKWGGMFGDNFQVAELTVLVEGAVSAGEFIHRQRFRPV